MEFGGLISSSNGIENKLLEVEFFNKGNPFLFCADYKNPILDLKE